MSSRAAFRKIDVTRAVQAVKAAGVDVVSVEVRRDGTIQVFAGTREALTKALGRGTNAWDRTCPAE